MNSLPAIPVVGPCFWPIFFWSGKKQHLKLYINNGWLERIRIVMNKSFSDFKKSGKTGRPPHKPTNETRATVIDLKSCGVPHKMIAARIGIDSNTLERHYRSELDVAMIENIKVAKRRLFDRIEDGEVGAIAFFLKAQAGWSEKTNVELTGAGGGPVETNIVFNPVNHAFQSDELDDD